METDHPCFSIAWSLVFCLLSCFSYMLALEISTVLGQGLGIDSGSSGPSSLSQAWGDVFCDAGDG